MSFIWHKISPSFLASILLPALALSACTKLMVPSEMPVPAATLDNILGCTEQVAAMPEPVILKQVADLQAQLLKANQQHETEQDIDQRIWLACFLSRESADDAALAHAQILLDGLAADLKDRRAERQLVQLLGERLLLMRRLRAQRAELLKFRNQNWDLRHKIEQLKGLERELDVGPVEEEPMP